MHDSDDEQLAQLQLQVATLSIDLDPTDRLLAAMIAQYVLNEPTLAHGYEDSTGGEISEWARKHDRWDAKLDGLRALLGIRLVNALTMPLVEGVRDGHQALRP